LIIFALRKFLTALVEPLALIVPLLLLAALWIRRRRRWFLAAELGPKVRPGAG